jgi:hypothetical protein
MLKKEEEKLLESPHTSSNWIQTTFFIYICMASGGKI